MSRRAVWCFAGLLAGVSFFCSPSVSAQQEATVTIENLIDYEPIFQLDTDPPGVTYYKFRIVAGGNFREGSFFATCRRRDGYEPWHSGVLLSSSANEWTMACGCYAPGPYELYAEVAQLQSGNAANARSNFDVTAAPVSVAIGEMSPRTDAMEYQITSAYTIPFGNGVISQGWEVQPRLTGGEFGSAVHFPTSVVRGRPGDRVVVRKGTCNGTVATAQGVLPDRCGNNPVPTVDVSVLRLGGTKRARATVHYDLKTTAGSVTLAVARWIDAAGVEHPGYPIETTITQRPAGTYSAEFPIGDSMQVFVTATAVGECNTVTADAGTEACCPTQDPVFLEDGNVQVTDTDPLPAIAGHQLERMTVRSRSWRCSAAGGPPCSRGD